MESRCSRKRNIHKHATSSFRFRSKRIDRSVILLSIGLIQPMPAKHGRLSRFNNEILVFEYCLSDANTKVIITAFQIQETVFLLLILNNISLQSIFISL